MRFLPTFAIGILFSVAAHAATVSGRVSDDAGMGIPSAIIAAYTSSGTLQGTATSDSTGRFALTVPPGTYRLLAYDNSGTYATTFFGDADSYESTRETAVTVDIANLSFVLRRAGSITGVVSSAIGSAENITVAAYNLNGSRRGFTTTTPAGAYTLVLPPGSYKLVAYDAAGNLAPKFFQEQPSFASATVVTVSAGQNTAIGFRLDAAAHFTGAVVDAATNQPLADIGVIAYDANGVAISRATTDVNGVFDLRVPGGAYRLVAADDKQAYATAYVGGSSFSTATLTAIGAGQTRANVRIALQRGGTISGRITDPAGTPLTATVAAYDQNGSLVATTQTSGGNYSFVLAPGTYRIAAYDESLVYATQFYSSQTVFRLATPVNMTAGQATAIDIVLSRGARISGTIFDAQTGLPIGGVTVAAYDANGDLAASATASSGGGYAFVVPAGAYRIVAFDALLRYATAFAGGSSFETSSVFTESASSSERIDFRVTRGVRVTGTVTTVSGTAIEGVEVTALDTNGNRVGAATTTASGFQLVLLPQVYRFVVTDPQSRFSTGYSSGSTVVSATGPAPSVTIVLTGRARRRAAPH